jgi:rhodanese-related sulfurtransferase
MLETKNKDQINPEDYAINAATLQKWLQQQTTILIDVREPVEYAREHIPGATLIPLSGLTSEQIPANSNKKIVLYCQSGNRSAQALKKLLANGLTNVFHLQNGLPTWITAGYPTKINKTAPISLMRQVQIVAGSLVLIGTLLGAFISPWFLLLSGFVGGGLTFAGITNTCLLARLLAKLPYNQGF